MNLHPEITAHLCSASEWTPAMKEYMKLWNQHNKLLNRHHKMVKRVGVLEAELLANTSMMASYKEMMANATGEYLEALDDLWGIANYKRIKAKQGLKRNNWEEVVRLEGKLSGLAAQMEVVARYILPQAAGPMEKQQPALPIAEELPSEAIAQEAAPTAEATLKAHENRDHSKAEKPAEASSVTETTPSIAPTPESQEPAKGPFPLLIFWYISPRALPLG